MSRFFCTNLFLLICLTSMNAQQDSLLEIGNNIIKIKTQSYQTAKKTARRMMSNDHSKFNVFYTLSSRLMYLYQNVLSEQIQAECVYAISCSEHAKLKIEKKGLFLGMLAGGYQLMNCFEGVVYDYPWYKINQDFKVKNGDE